MHLGLTFESIKELESVLIEVERIFFFNQVLCSCFLKKSGEQLSRMHFCFDSSNDYDDDWNTFAYL